MMLRSPPPSLPGKNISMANLNPVSRLILQFFIKYFMRGMMRQKKSWTKIDPEFWIPILLWYPCLNKLLRYIF